MLKGVATGNVVRDAELLNKDYPDGSSRIRCPFTVAVNRHSRRDDKPIFVNCTLWDKYAQDLCPYIKQGVKVTVSGDIIPNTFMRGDGNIQTNLQMTSVTVELMSPKKETEEKTIPAEVNFTPVEMDDEENNGLPF